MKTPVIVPAIFAGLLLSSCKKPPTTRQPGIEATAEKASSVVSSSPVPATPAKVDVDVLLKSFGTAGPEEQSRVGKAAQAIRAENFSSAVEILEHLLAQGHLTPEQTQLVKVFVARLNEVNSSK